MKVLKEGDNSKLYSKNDNELCCPNCHCIFAFKEGNIELATETIKYDKGIKKFLGFTKEYKTRKYVTCPWCKTIHKLKYTIDN